MSFETYFIIGLLFSLGACPLGQPWKGWAFGFFWAFVMTVAWPYFLGAELAAAREARK